VAPSPQPPAAESNGRRSDCVVDTDGLECLPEVLEELFPEAESVERACWSQQLAGYSRHLHRWSGRMNLVADGDRSELVAKHIIPSLLMRSAIVAIPHRQIVDIGSGAGLPGIPLKVVLPGTDFVLVESRRRRASFLREVVRRLSLGRISVENTRIEQWRNPRCGGAEVVTARAVASPAELLRLIRPILAPCGHLLVYLPTDRSPSEMNPPPVEVCTAAWRGVEVRLGLWKQSAGLA